MRYSITPQLQMSLCRPSYLALLKLHSTTFTNQVASPQRNIMHVNVDAARYIIGRCLPNQAAS